MYDATQDEPKDGSAVCDLVLSIINEITTNHLNSRPLHKNCAKHFRDGDTAGVPGNLKSFTKNYKTLQDWLNAKPNILAAARLHGALCNLSADFLDRKGTPSTEISPRVFKDAGILVTRLCPRALLASRGRGPWCTWP